jgi:hypothetical protein
MFRELSPPLMTSVFVNDAAGLAITTPALEGGFILHLPPLYPNVLRVNACRRGFGRARSDNLPQRIEHLSRGRPHHRGAHHPRGATPRPPIDLPAQVLPSDLLSLLKHCAVPSPVAWQPYTYSRSPGPFYSLRDDAPPLTTNSLSHLNLISLLHTIAGSYFIPKSPAINRMHVIVFYFPELVDTTAPYFFASKCFCRNVMVPNT